MDFILTTLECREKGISDRDQVAPMGSYLRLSNQGGQIYYDSWVFSGAPEFALNCTLGGFFPPFHMFFEPLQCARP